MSQHAPALSRPDWTSHPHWPEQVLLLGSHENFRRISAYLITAAGGGEGKRSNLTAIASLYLRWITGMRSHESYEEHKLYPYLARRWGTDFAGAEAGHVALHTAHAAVVEAIAEAAEQGEITPALVAALRAHDQALDVHLELEEELVIPGLLALSPAEFHRYTMLSLPSLLAELDAAAS